MKQKIKVLFICHGTNYSFNNGNKNVRRTCTPHIFI